MYTSDLAITSAMNTREYNCEDCNMIFNAPHLLAKHKKKFCLGGTGDPRALRMLEGLWSAEESPRRYSPDIDRPITDSELVRNKVRQLRDLKKKRSRDRDLKDLEERMLLDELEDTESELHGSPYRRERNRLPLSTHRDIRDLQVEYEKLREEENKTSLPVQPLSSRTERRSPYSRNSNSSMSIYLDDYRRSDPNQDQNLRNLAATHNTNMEYLHLRNKDLEKQREEIRKQLEALNKKPDKGRDSNAELLRLLKEQEEKNQKALDGLRRDLYSINNRRVDVIEVEKPVYQQPVQLPPQAPPPPPPEPPKKNYVVPVYFGPSLVQEIIAVRQAYLQNGGNDPLYLSQLDQMQAEAQALEDQNKKKQPEKPKAKPKDNMEQFNFLNAENERLLRELQFLQEQNAQAMNRRKSDREDELEAELRRMQDDHIRKMYQLQRDMDDLKLLLAMERNRPMQQPQAQDRTTIIQAPPPSISNRYVEVEPMVPYDPLPKSPSTFHHTWNYTQFYRPHAIPELRPPRNIDFSQPEREPARDDHGEIINK